MYAKLRKRRPKPNKIFKKKLTDIVNSISVTKKEEDINFKLLKLFTNYVKNKSYSGVDYKLNPFTNILLVEVAYLDFFVDSYLYINSPHRVSLDDFEFEASIFKVLESGKKIIQVDFYEKVTGLNQSFSPIYKLNAVFSEYENK